MGNCCSSKKPSPEPQVKQELPPEPDPMEERRKHIKVLEERRRQSRIQKEIRNNELFQDVVARAIKENKDLTTMNDLQSYIFKNHRSDVNGFHQKKVIQKVIGDEFLKGHLIIRSTKGCCR